MKKSIFKKIGGLFLGLAMGLGVVTGVAAGDKVGVVKAEDELYASMVFNSTNNSKGQSSYGNSWTNTTNGFTWNLANWNNNNNQWNLIKAGSKSTAYTATVVTANAVPVKISKINVDCSWSNSKVTSVKLLMGSSATSCTTSIATVTTGAKDYTISSPATNMFYKLEVVCNVGSNGMFVLNDMKLYEEKAAALPLSISGDSTVYNGKTITLSASSNSTAVTGVTWSSSNTSVATVNSSSGVVTGVNGSANGTNVTITAKKTGYADATKVITVKADTKTLKSISASVSVEHSTFTLGDSFTTEGLVVKGTYSRTNGDPDSVEEITSGITTSPTAGTKLNTVGPQTVTVNAGGKSTTYSINVNYAAVTSIELGYTEGTLGKGNSAVLPEVTVLPDNANQDYSWGNPIVSATSGEISYTFENGTLSIAADNTGEGTITFVATATGDSSKSANVVYTIEAAQIAHITGVTASATGTIVAKQYVGDAFNAQGFSFAPTWSEGDHDVVVITANDISWNALVAGSNPTGTYSCADGDFTVTITGVTVVNDTLASIAFDQECGMTNKTYYTTDKSFDHTGLSISGKMASGADAVIDTSEVEYIFSTTPAELGSGTGKSVSVYAKYGDAETDPITISGIEVKEIVLESISVTTKPSKLTYTIGESFSSTGIVVKGINNDGSDAGDLTSQCTFEYAETAFLTKGNPTITVEYGNKTATFTIEVNEKTLQPGTSKWTLVENINDLEIGDQIIITNSGHSQALGGQSSNNRGQVGVTYANNELTIGDSSPAIFELQNGKIDGTYAFYDSVNSGYLYAASSSSNYLRVESSLSNNSSFILTKNSAIAQGTNTRNSIRYNSGSSIFSCYGSGQAEINFFVQEVTPGESRTLAGITATYNHTGDTYYTGDEVVSADFTVKAWYNNGETVNNVSGFTITDSTLDKGDNTIELSYEGKKCTVLVSDIETRTATVDHVYVETETGYQVNYYLDGTTAAWNLEKINVVAYWTDGTTNTSSLSDLVESGDVTLSKAVPEVGDTSFTVSGSYYGTAVDSTHNSVTVSVVAKEITSLNWAKRFDGYSFNVFEGDTINKSAFAKQNSSSYIKANFNDETSDETYSIDNCSVALYRREGSSNIKVKDVTFDANGNYTFEAEDDGLYFLLTAGGKTTVYSDDAVFSVCERLNGIIVPGDDITKTIDTSNFSPALPTSTGSTGSSTAEGITFTYDGLYNYTKNSSSHIALPKTNGAYFASSKLSGDLKSIQVTKGDQAINSAATLYISKDGSTWTTAKVFDGSAFTYSITDEGYRYFKIVTNGSNYTNIGSLIVKYSGNTDVANTDSVTQKSVIEFAKYFYEELSEVCNSFDTTSDAFKEAWSNVSNKYDEMFGSSSTIEGLDKTLAANMFKYAYPNGRVGEEADVLQLAMQRYDTIVVRDASLSKFITRASSYNAPRLNNPIANLSNVDNSVWVISAVALIGLTAIGGYFFYRKRKENF